MLIKNRLKHDCCLVNFEDVFSTLREFKSYLKLFEKNSFSHDFINIQLKPLTGSEFESQGFTYANFKVRLTAVLLDQDGNELKDTNARDYIIYTNARIFQRIIQ